MMLGPPVATVIPLNRHLPIALVVMLTASRSLQVGWLLAKVAAADEKPIPADAKVVKVARDCRSTEGPAGDVDGKVAPKALKVLRWPRDSASDDEPWRNSTFPVLPYLV